ncbi:MAG: carbohydrate binding family 9 domain-containing protein [Acidobacteria bacterium]|nr:carbohydrate binding family 9 domain-containing protein [Acidobacteriota bacterium]
MAGCLPFILCLVTLAAATSAAGQSAAVIEGPAPPDLPEVVARDAEGRVTVRAVRLAEPLVLDGLLRDPVYSQVRAISDFIQQEPHEGEPATERTELWIFFDDATLYLSVHCLDSQPDQIIANEMRRDGNIFQNDNIQFVIDTFYDRRSGFSFQTNALGALRDQEISDERTTNTDWNTVWDVRAARTDDGWSAELAVPFKSLRYRASGPQIWGINVQRVARSKNERSFLSGVPASYGGRGINKLSSAATLVGLEVPPSGRNLEIKPYAISAVTTNRQVTPAISNDVSGDAGLDVKYGLTRGLTADFTYNTDFAQVEEDEQQVNLTRFSLFFPEKRDFFLEGQGIFQFGPSRESSFSGAATTLLPVVFFSRQIGLSRGQKVPILAGGRVTGRQGRYAVGALNIQTKEAPAAGAAATNFSVVRLRRDVLRRSAIGFIGTHRSPRAVGQASNQIVGVDAALAFYENVTINSYYARSRTPGRRGEEASYLGQFAYAGDRYGMNLEHLSVGDAFNPEIGFLRREAFRRSYAHGRFSPRPRSNPWLRKYSIEGSIDYITDPDGRLETREAQASSRIEFNNGGFWWSDYTRNYELIERPFEIAKGIVIAPGQYRFHGIQSTFYVPPQWRFTGRINGSSGTFYGGTRREVGYDGRVEVTSQLAVEPRVSINWVDLPVGRFTTRLLGSRVTYTMTTRAALSALVQYNSSNSTLSSNVRFRWEYRPGSDLFVVYSDGHEVVSPRPIALQSRAFVVKMTRLFRF